MKLKNTNKLGLLTILALAVTVTSCKKLDNLVQVNVGLQMAEVPFTIQANDVAGTATYTETIEFNVDSAIKANNASFGVANIKSATIDSVVVTLQDPATFTGVTNVHASLSSDANTNTVTIASTTATSTSSSLKLVPTSALDLTSYLNATSFTYSFTSTNPVIPNPVQANADVYFHLVVGPN